MIPTLGSPCSPIIDPLTLEASSLLGEEGDWIPNEIHKRCTSWLSSVILTQCLTVTHGMEFIGVRSVGGAMFGNHRHVSVMGVVVWLLLLVVLGLSCFGLYVVGSVLSFLSFLLCNSGF